jgi:CTP:molybdopterin cytidylyltransferase MocA
LLVSKPLAERRLGAVILAAGASERMGTPKALLAWGGTTLLDNAVERARAAGVQHIVVVLGPATRHLDRQLATDGVDVAFNPEPSAGRSASIRLGSNELPDEIDAVLVQSVDQPCESSVLTSLFGELDSSNADVAIPIYKGRRGHPACFARRLLPELRAVDEEAEGLRSVVRRHAERLIEVPVESESVVWNLNDPAAYAAARAAACQG